MNKTTDQASAPSASQKLLQEPMLHFFLIGLLIFALYAFSQSSKEDLLEVNRSDIDARITKKSQIHRKILPDIAEQYCSPDFYVSLVFSKNVFCAGFQTSLCKQRC